jgi:hypothetical protein
MLLNKTKEFCGFEHVDCHEGHRCLLGIIRTLAIPVNPLPDYHREHRYLLQTQYFAAAKELVSAHDVFLHYCVTAVSTVVFEYCNAHLREIGWDGMDWIDLAQDRDQWRDLMNTLMNLRVLQNAGKFLSSCTIGGFSNRAQLHERVNAHQCPYLLTLVVTYV